MALARLVARVTAIDLARPRVSGCLGTMPRAIKFVPAGRPAQIAEQADGWALYLSALVLNGDERFSACNK